MIPAPFLRIMSLSGLLTIFLSQCSFLCTLILPVSCPRALTQVILNLFVPVLISTYHIFTLLFPASSFTGAFFNHLPASPMHLPGTLHFKIQVSVLIRCSIRPRAGYLKSLFLLLPQHFLLYQMKCIWVFQIKASESYGQNPVFPVASFSEMLETL